MAVNDSTSTPPPTKRARVVEHGFTTPNKLASKKMLTITPGEKLPAESRKMIRRYTGDHSAFNKTLRGEKEMTVGSRQNILLLDCAIDSLPSFEAEVYRAINLKPDVLAKTFQVGRVYSDPAFLSTSRNTMIHEDMAQFRCCNCWLTIQSKTGRSIEEYVTSSHKNECEVLFKPATKFRVTSTKVGLDGHEKGKFLVHLTEIVE